MIHLLNFILQRFSLLSDLLFTEFFVLDFMIDRLQNSS